MARLLTVVTDRLLFRGLGRSVAFFLTVASAVPVLTVRLESGRGYFELIRRSRYRSQSWSLRPRS
jgi:hypothetical protein